MRVIQLLLLFLVFIPLVSFGRPVIYDFTGEENNQELTSYLEIYDGSTTVSIPENLKNTDFKPMKYTHVMKGVVEGVYWLKFVMSNQQQSLSRWVIVPQTAYVDFLSLYRKEGEEFIEVSAESDFEVFSTRAQGYRKLTLTDTVKPKETVAYYIKIGMVNPDSLSLKLSLFEERNFEGHRSNEQFIYGLYFGISIALLILTGLLWVTLRDKSYLYYFAYLLMNTTLWLYMSGYGFQYIIPNNPGLYNQSFNVVFLLVFITALQFSRSFLDLSRVIPLADKALKYLQALALMAIALRVAGFYESVLLISYAGFVLLGFLPLVGWWCYQRGEIFARWYIVSWSVYAAGIIFCVIWAFSKSYYWVDDPLFFTQWLSLLESFLLAVAMSDKVRELTKEYEQATEDSQHDALTGLGNRRLLKLRFDHVTKIAHKNGGKDLWLLMLDVDFFKRINDRYGHQVGDSVLKQFALILEGLCRPEDTVIRYGGEEFVILLHTADKKVARHISERIRETVKATAFETDDLKLSCTVSIGMAKYSKKTMATLEDFIDVADAALYSAKNSGRDCVVVQKDGKTKFLSQSK